MSNKKNKRMVSRWAARRAMECNLFKPDTLGFDVLCSAYDDGFKHGLEVAARWGEKYQTAIRLGAQPQVIVERRHKQDVHGPVIGAAIRKLKP